MSLVSFSKLAFLTISCAILLGCSQEKVVGHLDKYLERLSRVIDVERHDDNNFQQQYLTESESYRFPSSDLYVYLPQSEQAIGILEFLSLYGCRLQGLVAERNASLGKLARPSQQLIYELAFITHAPECIKALQAEGRDELVLQLANAVKEKRTRLAANIWQAIIVGDEAREFWKLPYDMGEYPDQDVFGPQSSLNALNDAVRKWLSEDYAYSNDSLEQHLKILNLPDGGPLLKSFLLYSLALDEANSMLEHATLCFNGRTRFNSTAAKNVVTQFFVRDIQSWVAQLSQRYYELMPLYRQLEASLETVESEKYREWRLKRDRLFEQAIQASQKHVKYLEVLLNGCQQG
jgi:hypothetical protein